MQPYSFHLAFELFADPPTSLNALHSAPPTAPPFCPPSNLDIFSATLPSHGTTSWASYFAPRKTFRRSKSAGTGLDGRIPVVSCHDSVRTPDHKLGDSIIPWADYKRHSKTKTLSYQSSSTSVASTTEQDWRFDQVVVESIDMERKADEFPGADASVDQSNTSAAAENLVLRGRYVPSDPKTTEFGYGVVHLYRDAEHSSDNIESTPSTLQGQQLASSSIDEDSAYVDKECTTLCILAVPSYMSPSDLLGWLGEDTRENVSHLRLVRTSRSNRYMALMKFREADVARKWQKDWNGKLFDSMEPENCHVVSVKSIRFQLPAQRDSTSFPDMSNDPFTPAVKPPNISEGNTLVPASLTSKPAPPPTPSLIELPTCPVCLERMDETNGLATIFCQHVFHCACLQKWRGSGCPVCRYTQKDPLSRNKTPDDEDHECAACGATANLWICLICGKVGCGRYDDAHAFAHFEQTSHRFAMDVATQHIWDYVGDEYVHRLIQNKSDGKLVELPPSTLGRNENPAHDMVPRDKLENMSLEYTYLLTSQLDSQRLYFKQQVDRAVDKASRAIAEAEQARDMAEQAQKELDALRSSHYVLKDESLPGVERDKERAERRAEKFEKMSRELQKQWRENEAINESLMDRITHLEKQVHDATLKNSDLEEQNRDLSFFISGMEKLKGAGEEVQEGQVTIGEKPDAKKKGKKKR